MLSATHPSTPALDHPELLPNGHRLPMGQVVSASRHSRIGPLYRVAEEGTGRILAVREYLPPGLCTRLRGQVEALPSRADTFHAGLRTFLEDGERLSGQDHPSLMRVERVWRAHGTGYVVSPWYAGRTVVDLVRDRVAPITQAEIERWLRALADALAPLHRGLGLHGRITPRNVLVLDNGLPVLMEPARALRVIDPHAHPSPFDPYVPIECAADDDGASAAAVPPGGRRPGPWSDVYALASLTRFAITGRHGIAPRKRQVVDWQEPLTDWKGGRYGSALLVGLDRALAVEPSQRPASLPDFLAGVGLRERRSRPRRDGTSLLMNLPQAVVHEPAEPTATRPVPAPGRPERAAAPRTALPIPLPPATSRPPAPVPASRPYPMPDELPAGSVTSDWLHPLDRDEGDSAFDARGFHPPWGSSGASGFHRSARSARGWVGAATAVGLLGVALTLAGLLAR